MRSWSRLLAGLGLLSVCGVASANEMTIDPSWPDAARGVLPVTVGPDPDCDVATVAAGILAAPAGGSVRVMTGTYNENQALGVYKSLRITGGYPDCNLASAPTGRSTVSRGGSGLVFDIFYDAAVGAATRLVELENLVITGGDGSGFSSGGVLVEGRPGRLSVNIRNTEISGNDRSGVDDDGAGLRIITTGDRDGSSTFVTLDNDSFVFNNSTAGDGGGIHCRSTHDQGTATTLRLGTTLVFDNSATNGGGIALDGCTNVFLYSGGPIVLIIPTGGIVGNTATDDGGGLYMINGATAQLRGTTFGSFGDPIEAALLIGNTATNGGGAYTRDAGTELIIEDAYVNGNDASSRGGGLYANLDSRIEVRRAASQGECLPPQSGGGVLSRPRCSVVDDNSAVGGGAFYAFGSSTIKVIRSYIRGNQGGNGLGAIGTAGNVSISDGPSAILSIEGSVIADNEGGFGLYATTSGFIEIVHSTLHDHVGTFGRAAAVAGRSATLSILGSIVDEPNSNMFQADGDGTATIRFDCVLSNRPTTDWGGTVITQSVGGVDPQFRDPDNGDFRLSDRSPAIDYCDDFANPQFAGLDGNPRGVAWTGPTPEPADNAVNDGTYDLGAYEMVFEPRTADLRAFIGSPDLFIDATQASVTFNLAVTNNGPETAYADVNVVDDVTAGALTNRQWACAPPPGVTCTPASGTGRVDTAISDLAPGDFVVISVDADLVTTSTDQEFDYAVDASPSAFNTDPNVQNNGEVITVRIGLFADGFESPAPF